MRRLTTPLTLVALFLLAALPAAAQSKGPAKPAKPKPSGETLRAWNSMARKIIEMAEDFPAEKYDYRPTKEVRNFGQMLLHIAAVNYFFTNAAEGREVAPAEDDPAPEKFKTKADIVAYVTRSFSDGAAAIQKKGDRGMAQAVKHPFGNGLTSLNSLARDMVEHSGEHYGNLVVYYRLNGMVPPASRPRK
jgi:uncharacterized damage-inducible protein DinB